MRTKAYMIASGGRSNVRQVQRQVPRVSPIVQATRLGASGGLCYLLAQGKEGVMYCPFCGDTVETATISWNCEDWLCKDCNGRWLAKYSEDGISLEYIGHLHEPNTPIPKQDNPEDSNEVQG